MPKRRLTISKPSPYVSDWPTTSRRFPNIAATWV
jgi:hypothetical protein